MPSIRVKAVNIDFELTCGACPEQYDVFIEGKQVGYVRLRWGNLTCSYPDVGGREVYRHCFDDGMQGIFDTDEEREYHLDLIAKAIYNRYIDSESRQHEHERNC